MPRSSVPTKTIKTPSEISALSQRVGKMLRAFGKAREHDRMTSDEALIFLALGHLGQTATSTGMVIRPVTCLHLADLLNIPKETVRRKVSHLLELELVTSTTRGVLMENEMEWRRLAEAIAS